MFSSVISGAAAPSSPITISKRRSWIFTDPQFPTDNNIPLPKPDRKKKGFYIRNETGTSLFFATENASVTGRAKSLEAGQEKDIFEDTQVQLTDKDEDKDLPRPSSFALLLFLSLDSKPHAIHGRLPIGTAGLFVLSLPLDVVKTLFGKSGGTEIVCQSSGRVLLLRSAVVLKNHTFAPIVACIEPFDRKDAKSTSSSKGPRLQPCVQVLPARKSASFAGFPVPLRLVKGIVKIKPQNQSVPWSNSVCLNDLWNPSACVGLQCQEESRNEKLFSVYSQTINSVFERNLGRPIPRPPIEIRFAAPLTIKNQLPYRMSFQIFAAGDNLRGKGRLDPEQKLFYLLGYTEITELRLSVSFEDGKESVAKRFSKARDISKSKFLKVPQPSIESADSEAVPILLQVFIHARRESKGRILPAHHSRKVSLFCPYWIVNRSGMNLLLRSVDRLAPDAVLRKDEACPFPFCGMAYRSKSYKLKNNASSEDPYSSDVALSLLEGGVSFGETINLGSNLSSRYSLDVVGKKADGGPQIVKAYEFTLNISITSSLTRVVSILPRFILLNRSMCPNLICRQTRTGENFTTPQGMFQKDCLRCPSGEHIPFQWPSPSGTKTLQLKFDGRQNLMWSGAFPIDKVNVYDVVLYNEDSTCLVCVRVHTEQQGETFLVFIDNAEKAPYILRNELPVDASFRAQDETVMPKVVVRRIGGDVQYTFSNPNPSNTRVLTVEFEHPDTRAPIRQRIELKKFSSKIELFRDSDLVIYCSYTQIGPQREIRLWLERTSRPDQPPDRGSGVQAPNRRPKWKTGGKIAGRATSMATRLLRTVSSSMPTQSRIISSMSGQNLPALAQPQAASMDLELKLDLQGVLLSLNDNQARELFLLSFQMIEVVLRQAKETIDLQKLSIQTIQIDQMFHWRPGFLVLLGPIHPPTRKRSRARTYWGPMVDSSGEALVEQPACLLVSLSISLQHPDVDYFNSIDISLQPLDIRVHAETFILLESLAQGLWNRFKPIAHQLYPNRCDLKTLDSVSTDKVLIRARPQRRLYLGSLRISPLHIEVTVKASGTPGNDVSNSPLVASIVDSFGGAVLNLERVPIKISECTFDNVFERPEAVGMKLARHYVKEGAQATGRVLGHLNVLGNPLEMINSIKEGTRELLVGASQTLLAPAAVEGGLSRGTTSLAKGLIQSVALGTSRMSGTLGNIITRFTSVRAMYAHKIRKEQDAVPVTYAQGLRQGARLFGLRTASGVLGMFRMPLDEGKDRGFSGFGLGIVKGGTGLILQPATGIIDLMSKSTEGLNNSISSDWAIWNDGRFRLPRTCGAYLNVIPFDPRLAAGQNALRTAKNLRIVDSERVLDEFTVCEHDAVFLTSRSVVYENRADAYKSWQAKYEDLNRCEKVKVWDRFAFVQGVRVVLQTDPPAMAFIPCSSDIAEMLVSRIQNIMEGKEWVARMPEGTLLENSVTDE
mmetsp:Transcript_2524/g.3852  ORF Transcript_2524/g.3852 Transcript_2524/m.3852 type:complete len:1451 (+) Transcript_2524:2370-6722(+)